MGEVALTTLALPSVGMELRGKIKWISLFQDDRLPRSLGPINCDSPASWSLLIGETIPVDCGRAGKGFKGIGPL